VTARRTLAIGFGGAVAVIAAATVGNLLGVIVEQAVHEEWPGHATVHLVFGGLALAIALWVGRVRRASLARGWAQRGLEAVRLIAFVVSATAVVEGVGAYPPFEVLHNIVYVNVIALLVLLLGFLFIAAVGVVRLVRERTHSGPPSDG
jgi:hypothetical protein